jgi:hypothetical protein
MKSFAGLRWRGSWSEERTYEELRRFAVARFMDTKNAQVAEQTLKACLLFPAEKTFLKSLVPLAKRVEHAVDSREGVFGRRPGNLAWGGFALSFAKVSSVEGQETWPGVALLFHCGATARANLAKPGSG